MKLAVTYMFKLFLVWASARTIYQLVNSLGEDFTAYRYLLPLRVRYSVRVCFEYESLTVIHQSNNKTTKDCLRIFDEEKCKVWRRNDSLPSFLHGYTPGKFIEFGRRVFTENRMLTIYNTSLYDQQYYLAQRMFCVVYQRNKYVKDDSFEMKVNLINRISNAAARKIQLRIYLNNQNSYPDRNDYIFSISLKELRKSAVVILLRHEMFIEHYLLVNRAELFEHLRYKHNEVNQSMRFCRYRCERQSKLHNPTLLYLDDDENITLSEEGLLDVRKVKEIIENCVQYCRFSSVVSQFYTVAGLAQIAKEELDMSSDQSLIHLWFYKNELIFRRPKLCFIDFVINVGFVFSLYFGYNLIGLSSIVDYLIKQKWRLKKLYELVLLFVSIFFLVSIRNHYYEQLEDSDWSRYSRFLPGFSNFTFSICFPLASMLKNSSQTFDQISVKQLDEMTLGLEEVTVGFNLLNMATLKRSKIELFNQNRSFYFRKDKCFAFNVNKSVIFTDQPFFEHDESASEVYFRLFERYLQLYMIFNQTFLIYLTEHDQLPFYWSEFTNDPMSFLKTEDETEQAFLYDSPMVRTKYNCERYSECANKCILSKTIRNNTDGTGFPYDAVVEPNKLNSSLLDLPFNVLDRKVSIKIENDCLEEFHSAVAPRFIFSSYISSRALDISELLILQLSMPSNTYTTMTLSDSFDVILNLIGCYFLIFGSSFYSAVFLLKTYLKKCTFQNHLLNIHHHSLNIHNHPLNIHNHSLNSSIQSNQQRFVHETLDKFRKTFFEISFILTCIVGLYVLLSQTYDQVKKNPTVVSHQVSKYG